ncbi:MAG TPA: hypothetical protein VFW07_22295 [Parafilimonas sp.]|nr:hypothetical protein [Parafilimonas sp.]
MSIRPSAYVADSFVDYLESKEKELSSSTDYSERMNTQKQRNTIDRILNFLQCAKINTDLSASRVENIYNPIAGNKNFQTMKEYLYHKALKNDLICNVSFEQSLTNNISFEKFIQETDDPNAVYFIPLDVAESQIIQNKFGLVVIGNGFDFNSFYEDKNFAGKTISKGMDEITVCKHPCNSLIIVDPYFFSGKNWKMNKAPGIIKIIKAFILENLSLKFHLLILTEMDKSISDYKPQINFLMECLGGNENLFMESYIDSSKIFSSDRLFITNYAYINIGHPFDRETCLNSTIFFSGNNQESIKENFDEQMKKIELIRDSIKKIPKTIGTIKTVLKTNEVDANRLLYM